jgi:hypothetical protein
VSVVTQSQLAIAQQWNAQRCALHEEWAWHAPAAPTTRESAERFFPLPSWEQGRAWLRHHGWGFPYCTTDRMTITWFFEPFQTDLDELVSAQGLTDLECLYAVMLQVSERERQ